MSKLSNHDEQQRFGKQLVAVSGAIGLGLWLVLLAIALAHFWPAP